MPDTDDRNLGEPLFKTIPGHKHPTLTQTGRKLIENAIDTMFERLKLIFLGPGADTKGKSITIRARSEKSLTGLFNSASQHEGMEPRKEVLSGFLRVAGSYLDAVKEKAKAKTTQAVESFLRQTGAKAKKVDVREVLGEQLKGVWATVHSDTARIVNTEASTVRNGAIFDSIGRMGALTGTQDPVVFFVVIHDNTTCSTCRTLHLMPDGITPRLWLMSEISHAYYKKGQTVPCVQGPHPFCRCSMTTLRPGFGFDSAGKVTWRAPGHEELRLQRSK